MIINNNPNKKIIKIKVEGGIKLIQIKHNKITIINGVIESNNLEAKNHRKHNIIYNNKISKIKVQFGVQMTIKLTKVQMDGALKILINKAKTNYRIIIYNNIIIGVQEIQIK